MKKLFIDYHPKRVCVAMTENNELKEYYVEKATKPKIVGNIYKGKVVNTLQGMKAAFVNIGLEKNAFLYAGETLVDKTTLGDGALVMPQKLNVSPGDRIMCQVVKDYFGTKGVRVRKTYRCRAGSWSLCRRWITLAYLIKFPTRQDGTRF